MINVIAFTGRAGSGKSTAAKVLVDQGWTLVKFASPLKAMLRAYYTEIGFDPATIDRKIEGDLKEKRCFSLGGKTPRYAMQTLGTEWGRGKLGPHMWVDAWDTRAVDVLEGGGRVVCDDCRFSNEAAVVRRLGGKVVRIAGRGGIGTSHSSEHIDLRADETIYNNISVETLGRMVSDLTTGS